MRAMSSTENVLPDTPVMRQYQELKKAHPQALMFFRLGPGPHPAPGDSAVWVLHRDAVFPYLVCAQRAALTTTGCVSEPSFILESDDDMLPLSEWPRVQRLLQALNL